MFLSLIFHSSVAMHTSVVVIVALLSVLYANAFKSTRPFIVGKSVVVGATTGVVKDTPPTAVSPEQKVLVAGSTGYIGRAVVKELVSRGIPTSALVRNAADISNITRKYLEGSEIIECNVLDYKDTERNVLACKPTAIVCCLASRNGLNAFEVDYQGGVNVLNALGALNSHSSQEQNHHYVLLSAYCCGKPRLQFQFAKLQLEEEIRKFSASSGISHSIVRPTAFFKSVDGQIESVRKGSPVLYFGNGECSANTISEVDCAKFLVDSAIRPEEIDMKNAVR